ncbi:type IX secretion system membrane protein PorP/SprF [Pedobacter frigiditerrae]|uniref:Type IX secretion system membrane protein PorP/SprF n=1 Tax=Pedobacter frigiditerrae TaxID=2530452 RepID=A0A4R0N262_9SPHI|nr:PorP/SprF family type IX secretion system membrane protein [Pedobacter frigiditerrae]TCC93373.1 type IX secretion system membrane protein PorP/SprF [Pedobacter frigiditerrae]
MMKRIFVAILSIGFCFGFLITKAQDHVFSQFFNAPIYLNPSLTGQFDGDLRLNMIYRNQWSSLGGDLSYINASVDVAVPKLAGGVGLSFNRSSEGVAYLTKNNVAATYSYSVGGDEFLASFGIQAGFTNRSIDWRKLVFSDQLDRRIGYDPSIISSAQLPEVSNRFFFDPAAGVNFVYRNAMLGASVYHINRPDESFSGTQARLPARFVINASFKMPLSYNYNYLEDEGAFLIPSVVYYKQGNVSSISAGAQFKYRGFNAGAWYRTNQQGGSDAFVLSLIVDVFLQRRDTEKIRFGVSHDATTSKINYTNTSGTTEGSIGYEKYWANSTRTKKYNGLRCSAFY